MIPGKVCFKKKIFPLIFTMISFLNRGTVTHLQVQHDMNALVIKIYFPPDVDTVPMNYS